MSDPIAEQSPKTDAGLRARARRRRLGKTLQEVSDAAEVSKGHLSRFERGQKVLSVAAMLRLAQALETNVAALTDDGGAKDEYHVSRAQTRQMIADRGYGYAALSGSGNSGSHTTILLVLDQTQVHTPQARHAGQELLFVVEGTAQLRLGTEEIALNAGDYVEFPGHVVHEIQSISSECVILLTVIQERG